MYSGFFGIEIAKKALFANQKAQQNVAHNIANANTEGYSRQRVVLESTYTKPFAGLFTGAGAVQIGTGVTIGDITRIRDNFTDRQYRDENSSLGQWSVQTDILKQVEAVFNEPSDIGISSVLTKFWQALEELSKNPEAIEIRETVKERAITLADTINHTSRQLNEILGDVNFRIAVKVDEINSLAKQIASLNGEIRHMELSGTTAADLRDKRDLLLDQLSKIVDIETYEDQNGLFSVNVGGAILVKGTDYNTVSFDQTDLTAIPKWDGFNIDLNSKKGELIGLIELRDNKLGAYLSDLKTFAQTFADKFNEIHKSGYDLYGNLGVDFFLYNPLDSGDLLFVNTEITGDLKKIAAAETSTGIPGDNRNALKLADLRQKYLNDLNGSLDDFYSALISRIGIDSQQAKRMAEAQEYMVSQLDERRKEISSVSIDEEMAKMIMYQHAYNAAARMITTMDEMMERILNMGIVGR